jgi:hypothetical protein
MPITSTTFTAPPLRRGHRAWLPTGFAWLCQIASTGRLRQFTKVLRSRGPRIGTAVTKHPEHVCKNAFEPEFIPAAGGTSRAMDLAFSPQSFASGWLDRRP